MSQYILSLDQGTTSSRAIIFDEKVNNIMACQEEFTQIYPKPGWVEHDPEELFQCQLKVMKEAVEKSKINLQDLKAVGITNQRETVVLWERQTGKPVYNAIVWQCRRTADTAECLASGGYSQMIREKTGLIPEQK